MAHIQVIPKMKVTPETARNVLAGCETMMRVLDNSTAREMLDRAGLEIDVDELSLLVRDCLRVLHPTKKQQERAKRLDEIRARLKAATGGQWSAALGSGIHECTAIVADLGPTHLDPAAVHPPVFVADLAPDWAVKEGRAAVGEQHVANLVFFENVRGDLEYLLALAEEQ